MLPVKAVKKFIKREEEQGKKLEEAHRRRYNRSLRVTERRPSGEIVGGIERDVEVQVIYPSRFLREMGRLGLRAAQAPRLAPHNSCARIWWFRTLGGHVCNHLGATEPDWVTKDRVWWVTLVDRDHLYDPDAWEEVDEDDEHADPPKPLPKPEATDLAKHYRRLMQVVDDAVLSLPNFLSGDVERRLDHTDKVQPFHALVWGVGEERLKEHCKRLRKKVRAVLPYATSADYRQVNEGDLLQMLWYMTKAPRKQYQLYRRPETGTLAQFKRDINGVNSVLLHREMAHMTLDQLTLAGGEGKKLLKRTMRDTKRWRESNRRTMRWLARWRRRRRLRRLRATTPPTRAAKEQNRGRKGEKRAQREQKEL
jgi:hypothetical protein